MLSTEFNKWTGAPLLLILTIQWLRFAHFQFSVFNFRKFHWTALKQRVPAICSSKRLCANSRLSNPAVSRMASWFRKIRELSKNYLGTFEANELPTNFIINGIESTDRSIRRCLTVSKLIQSDCYPQFELETVSFTNFTCNSSNALRSIMILFQW